MLSRRGRASTGQAHRVAMGRRHPDRPARQMPSAYRIRGPLDVDRLQDAFRQVVVRHDALRMGFAGADHDLQYVVHDRVEWRLDVRDVRAAGAAAGEPPDAGAAGGALPAAVLADLPQLQYQPFDLSAPPLLRATVWRLGPEDWVLVVLAEHLVVDGLSLQVVINDLGAAYGGRLDRTPPPSYADWIDGQWAYLTGAESRADRAYWEAALAPLPDGIATMLPDFDVAAAQQRYGDGDVVRHPIPVPLADAVRELGPPNRATAFMFHLAALALCASRRTGRPKVCVHGAVGNRTGDQLGMVGWCAHGVAYVIDVAAAATPAELLAAARTATLDVLSHQRFPLLRWRVENDPGTFGLPLVAPYLFLQPVGRPGRNLELDLDGLSCTTAYVRFLETDLALSVVPDADRGRPGLMLTFNDVGYDRDRAGRLLADLEAALRRMADQPQTRLDGGQPTGRSPSMRW